MTAPIFVDTNVLVYARDAANSDKQARAAAWIEHAWRTRCGRLSLQVLHEYYVAVTRKLTPGMRATDARKDVKDLVAWQPVPLSAGLLDQAWSIETRFRLSFWDALIVAAANEADCGILLTEDLNPGQKFDKVTVVNPFETDVHQIGI